MLLSLAKTCSKATLPDPLAQAAEEPEPCAGSSVAGPGREPETPEVPHACEIETLLGREPLLLNLHLEQVWDAPLRLFVQKVLGDQEACLRNCEKARESW